MVLLVRSIYFLGHLIYLKLIKEQIIIFRHLFWSFAIWTVDLSDSGSAFWPPGLYKTINSLLTWKCLIFYLYVFSWIIESFFVSWGRRMEPKEQFEVDHHSRNWRTLIQGWFSRTSTYGKPFGSRRFSKGSRRSSVHWYLSSSYLVTMTNDVF